MIIPTYNSIKWLPDCLKSLSSIFQYEILIIDGSVDSVATTIKEICAIHNNVRYYKQKGVGIVDALNYGLEVSTAPYIARLDSDDVSFPDRFEKQVFELDNNLKLGALGTQFKSIDSEGKETGKVSQFPLNHKAIDNLLLNRICCIQHPTVMMRREAAIAVGGYRKITEYVEDFDLWLRISEKYEIKNLKEPLLYYRVHDGQLSQSPGWSQWVLVELAILSAQRRRKGQLDPLEPYANSKLADLPLSIDDRQLKNLICIYHLTTNSQMASHISIGDLASILSQLQLKQLGSAKKQRARLASFILRAAIRLRNPTLILKSFIFGLREKPFVFLRAL